MSRLWEVVLAHWEAVILAHCLGEEHQSCQNYHRLWRRALTLVTMTAVNNLSTSPPPVIPWMYQILTTYLHVHWHTWGAAHLVCDSAKVAKPAYAVLPLLIPQTPLLMQFLPTDGAIWAGTLKSLISSLLLISAPQLALQLAPLDGKATPAGAFSGQDQPDSLQMHGILAPFHLPATAGTSLLVFWFWQRQQWWGPQQVVHGLGHDQRKVAGLMIPASLLSRRYMSNSVL
jgi:hypothetical protein